MRDQELGELEKRLCRALRPRQRDRPLCKIKRVMSIW